ncbi:phosphoribosylformylglycinamidine synthase subunit PurL [candidate division KSB1 bacterium]|nr:phosphoribosylformylglycinamidine synthase subunit PurL [candidate division KSB1 bacterium]
MTEPEVTDELAEEHGLTEEEFEKIKKILGRIPTYTELGIFSVMWSEHASYKSSLLELKKLPREGGSLLVSAGSENAGLVDIGEGLAVSFKIESHNHPSAVEPYQGAATGVGGILRDIFTMGARPIACLDSLRFGELTNDRQKYLFRQVVKGIGDYGNCFGVPTVAGEVYFEDVYAGNPLVNAMAVGVVKYENVARAAAEGEGNPVLIVGSSTGRDGIHGTTFASEELSEKSEERRPQVQVGDPFAEKLLLEATLELVKQDFLIGIQDMGAAGLTCSTTEMAARGNCGMEIELTKVPLREGEMTPYEIMLSESQERMLVVVKKGYESMVKEIFKKWDLNSEVIGHVTGDGRLRVRNHGEVVAEVPVKNLVLGGTPVYQRPRRKPKYLAELRSFKPASLAAPKNLNKVLLTLLASPSLANKAWVTEQYDTSVRTNTVQGPGADAAVIRLKGTDKALVMKTDGNGRYVYLNPRRGAQIAVAEAARNVVCAGGRPVAVTNCLNFGNPQNPEIFWQFQEAVAGMGEACRKLGTPVASGNVSFYNEDPNGAIYPTPVIGMLGLIEDLNHTTTPRFKEKGNLIALIGKNGPHIGGSEYLKKIFGLVSGDCPDLDLDFESRVQRVCLKAIRLGIIASAHDCSEGGLGIALAECCILGGGKAIGARITLPKDASDLRPDFLLFSETQSRIILSLNEINWVILEKMGKEADIPITVIGRVGGDRLIINDWIDLTLEKMDDTYRSAIRKIMEP